MILLYDNDSIVKTFRHILVSNLEYGDILHIRSVWHNSYTHNLAYIAHKTKLLLVGKLNGPDVDFCRSPCTFRIMDEVTMDRTYSRKGEGRYMDGLDEETYWNVPTSSTDKDTGGC
jgi:hypothetical protein